MVKDYDEPLINIPVSQTETPATTDIKDSIIDLVQSQRFMVLCTQGDTQPYGSVLAYYITENMQQAFFATPTNTRKYSLLNACNRVAMVIDNRSEYIDDINNIGAVTITGKACTIEPGLKRETLSQKLSERHPYLKSFLDSPSTALVQVDIYRYFYVTRFQEVYQWYPAEAI